MPGRERDGLGFRAAPAQEKALTYLARTVKPQGFRVECLGERGTV